MKARGNVEIVTADAAAAVAEQALLAVGALPPLRAHQQQGAVGGPAADIDDQHPLFFTEGRFEIEPGGHRFKLKDHIAETGAVGGPLKDPLRRAFASSPPRPRKLIGRPITARSICSGSWLSACNLICSIMAQTGLQTGPPAAASARWRRGRIWAI